MPLQSRRPNLPAIALPPPSRHSSLGEDVHTPIPFTPMPFEQAPLVMTPDTPSFPLQSLDAAVAASDVSNAKTTALKWTEDEEGILQSYLMHPPRSLSTSYPPGTLPPPNALDEITTQLVTSSWRHSWQATRQRLFNVARKESMSAVGGHKRDKSESMIIAPMMPPQVRPKLSVTGGTSMSRQQHSMDLLFGDEEPKGFSETLRLSGSLQDTAARDSNTVLTSGDGLSSPLVCNFNINSSRKGYPFPTAHLAATRPTSLLQRGRSYTSEDFARHHEHAVESGDSPTTPAKFRPDMQRSASSPVSSMTISPPSSVSSSSIAEDVEMEAEMEIELGSRIEAGLRIEADPFTPLNQTFPHSIHGLRDPGVSTGTSSDGSAHTTPAGTPAIVLTIESPTQATPRMTSTDSPSPANAFANLSLSTRLPLNYDPPTISTTGGLRRSMRPPPLSRSMSDSTGIHSTIAHPNKSAGTVRPLYDGMADREAKRPRFRPSSALSVAVPKPGHWAEELRSPFEIKSVNP